MNKFWEYVVMIICLSILFGLHFLSFSYPNLALGIFLIWVGIALWSIEYTSDNEKTVKKLDELLKQSMKVSEDLLDDLKKTTKYNKYLEVISALLLSKLHKVIPEKEPNEILDELLKELKDKNAESNNKEM